MHEDMAHFKCGGRFTRFFSFRRLDSISSTWNSTSSQW